MKLVAVSSELTVGSPQFARSLHERARCLVEAFLSPNPDESAHMFDSLLSLLLASFLQNAIVKAFHPHQTFWRDVSQMNHAPAPFLKERLAQCFEQAQGRTRKSQQ